jgi:eukaryotic-like serine/threonine-protein kinase
MIQGTTKICKKCKSINQPGASFCSSCGLSFMRQEWSTITTSVSDFSFQDSRDREMEEHDLVKDAGDRFRVRSVIFNDDNGSVFEAWDNLNGTEVVFKGDVESDLGENALAFFRNGFRMSGKRFQSINHPQLPEVRDFFYKHNHYCVVMDFIQGKSLYSILSREKTKSIKITFAIKCILAVSELLEILHSINPPIYHLNIKPTKIIITDDGKVSLIPWLVRPGIHGDLVGTRGYAAPEQYCGQYDARSDVYGLGALLHAILTGRDPQKEVPFHFLPLSIFRPDLSGEIEMILGKALQLKREDRFQSVKDFSRALISVAGKYLK